jgi:hypothetical protein
MKLNGEFLALLDSTHDFELQLNHIHINNDQEHFSVLDVIFPENIGHRLDDFFLGRCLYCSEFFFDFSE